MSLAQQEALQEQIEKDKKFLIEFAGTGVLTPDDEAEIEKFREEIAAKEMALNGIKLMSERARGDTSDRGVEDLQSTTYMVTKEKIHWLPDAVTPVEASLHTSHGGRKFWFANITALSHATETDSRDFSPSQVAELERKIVRHIGIKMDQDDRRNGDLRNLAGEPVSRNTELNSYKEDNITARGLRANHARALILEDTSTENPTFLLAQICTHDQQEAQIYELGS